MKYVYSFIVFLCLLNNANTQDRSSIWHFGQNVELDFCNGDPITGTGIGTGPIVTGEGCASINDVNCNWQFSTDGINVIVPNPAPTVVDNDLMGDPSSTSSSIIVPKPCDNDIYYIFTVDYVDGTNGIRFSVYDQNENGGIGGVRANEKNILLAGPSAERITAVKHANGKDYWVIAVMQNTNEFYRWLVTCQGVSNVRPTVQTGPIITRSYGYLKASHCCDQLAMAHKGDVFLYNFDNATGFINHTNTITLSTNETMYGVDYSFDCSHLIATELGTNGGTNANIYRISDPCNSPNLTQTWTINNGGGRYTLGAVQKGPDDYMYIAKDLETSLATLDPSCSVLNQTGILLQGGTLSTLGLPTLISGNTDESCTDLTRFPAKPSNIKTAPLINATMEKGVEYVDFNNDGLFDIITAVGNQVVVYINTGTLGNPSFNFTAPNTTLHTITLTPGNNFMTFAMDGLDLYVLYEIGGPGVATLDYVQGTANPSAGGFATYAAPVNVMASAPFLYFNVADLDNDSSPEIVGSAGSGTGTPINYYDFIGGSFVAVAGNPILNVCFPSSLISAAFPIPEFNDVDCDGDLDLFLGIQENVFYYENTGNINNFIVQDCNTPGSPCQATSPCTFQSADFGITNVGSDSEYVFPRFVEVNNDGKVDLYISRLDCSAGCTSETQYYESQDCCLCPFELCFDYSPIPSGFYEADLLIKSTGTIPVGNVVTFKADAKQYDPPFTVNGALNDIAPGCSSCCGVNDPLVDFPWMAPFVGDPNYSIQQCLLNGECVFAVSDFCIVSDGLLTYYDCEGIEICFSSGFASNCPPGFSPTNCVTLQSCI